MHRKEPKPSGRTYGPGQRELSYASVEQAEAAARVFQKRGYRRRSRSLVPGDVLVAENAQGGFSVVWIPRDAAASPSPAREGPGEAGSSQLTPRPLAGLRDGINRPGVRAPEGQGMRSRAGAARMTDFHQAALPPAWHLADEAILPAGRTVTGTAARVYNLLAETNRRHHRWQVGRHLAPAGWVPTWVLREPWAGGAAGDRRLRDLREAGVSIESQRFDPGVNEPASASWLWRLNLCSGSPSPGGRECGWEKGPGDEGPPAPLQGIAVRFVAGRPAPVEAIDISPGAPSPLAPSFAACADEAYRRELLQAFHSGRLVAALTGRREWSLWSDPAAIYNPRPVLEAALTKLGAVLGS